MKNVMVRTLVILVLGLAFAVVAGPRVAEADERDDRFGDEAVNYVQGDDKVVGNGAGQVILPGNANKDSAEGAPKHDGTNDANKFLSLGFNGSVEMKFTDNIIADGGANPSYTMPQAERDKLKYDLKVWEAPGTPERAEVFAWDRLDNAFESLGLTDAGGAVAGAGGNPHAFGVAPIEDIGEGWFSYFDIDLMGQQRKADSNSTTRIKIVDKNNPGNKGIPHSAGFDFDAVEGLWGWTEERIIAPVLSRQPWKYRYKVHNATDYHMRDFWLDISDIPSLIGLRGDTLHPRRPQPGWEFKDQLDTSPNFPGARAFPAAPPAPQPLEPNPNRMLQVKHMGFPDVIFPGAETAWEFKFSSFAPPWVSNPAVINSPEVGVIKWEFHKTATEMTPYAYSVQDITVPDPPSDVASLSGGFLGVVGPTYEYEYTLDWVSGEVFGVEFTLDPTVEIVPGSFWASDSEWDLMRDTNLLAPDNLFANIGTANAGSPLTGLNPTVTFGFASYSPPGDVFALAPGFGDYTVGPVSAVPEPSVCLLLSLGALGLVVKRRA